MSVECGGGFWAGRLGREGAEVERKRQEVDASSEIYSTCVLNADARTFHG